MQANATFSRQLFHSLFPALTLCLFSLLLIPRLSSAQQADITEFTVTNSGNQLSLYLTISECFTTDMLTAVQNGIPITFTFYVEMYRVRPGWLDKKVRDYKFNHTMEYDSLKKVYTINREEKDDSRTTGLLDEAKLIMAEINGFRLMPIEEISPNASYIVKAKAKLARKSLPLYFHYIVPFTSLWDFETEWHQLTVRLKP